MSHRSRYFESYAYRDIIMDFWKRDKRVLWKSAPKPTMADSMFNKDYFYKWTS
jgi:glycine amidinotransferase